MVDAVIVETTPLTFEVSHPNADSKLIVSRDNPQYATFTVRYSSNSPTPSCLEGRYLSAQDATKACARYLQNKKESAKVRRDFLAERAKIRKEKAKK